MSDGWFYVVEVPETVNVTPEKLEDLRVKIDLAAREGRTIAVQGMTVKALPRTTTSSAFPE